MLKFIDSTGQEIAWLDQRIIADAPRIVTHMAVQDGDRLDLMAHRAYGDARQSWRIMDANPDPAPLALADTPGRRLKLAQAGEE